MQYIIYLARIMSETLLNMHCWQYMLKTNKLCCNGLFVVYLLHSYWKLSFWSIHCLRVNLRASLSIKLYSLATHSGMYLDVEIFNIALIQYILHYITLVQYTLHYITLIQSTLHYTYIVHSIHCYIHIYQSTLHSVCCQGTN